MTSCGVEAILQTDFDGASDLRSLSMAHNKIKELQPLVFQNAPNISAIDLAHNQIKELPKNTFVGAEQLKSLNLSHNAIRKLGAGIFSDLRKLDSIKLDHNQLESIESVTFTGCGALHTVTLNGNRIRALEGTTFEHLVHLKLVDLSKNLLSEFHTIFLRSAQLDFSISDNNLSEIEVQEWNSFDASNNGITELIVAADTTFNMRELNLGGDSISNLSLIFAQFKDLEYLDLSDGKVGHLSVRTLSKFRSLRKLYLRNCSLGSITYGT